MPRKARSLAVLIHVNLSCRKFFSWLIVFNLPVLCYVLFLFLFSRAVIGVGVEEEDRKHTWLDDADSVSKHVIIVSLSRDYYVLTTCSSHSNLILTT